MRLAITKIVPGGAKASAGCINNARYWMHFGQNILCLFFNCHLEQ
jgi:hypothetical protein